MSWLDILGSIFEVGSTAAGASSGSGIGLSGLAGILGPITGAATPSASSPKANYLLTALGELARSYKATPLAGATEDEIKRANRENLIAGTLGALMTGYGQYSQQEANKQALVGLADILAKGPQTPQGPVRPGETMAPISMSQQLAQWTQQNPQMAELGIKALESARTNEAKIAVEQAKALRKAMEGPSDLSLLQQAELLGVQPEDRANWMAQKRQELQSQALQGFNQPSFVAPSRPTVGGTTQPTEPTTSRDVVLPPGTDMDAITKALQGQGILKAEGELGADGVIRPTTPAPSYGAPGTTRELEMRGIEQQKTQKESELFRKNKKDSLDEVMRSARQAKVIEASGTLAQAQESLKSSLDKGKPLTLQQQERLLAILARATDNSMFAEGEAARVRSSLLGKLGAIQNELKGYTSKEPIPLPESATKEIISEFNNLSVRIEDQLDSLEGTYKSLMSAYGTPDQSTTIFGQQKQKLGGYKDYFQSKIGDVGVSQFAAPSTMQAAGGGTDDEIIRQLGLPRGTRILRRIPANAR